MASLRCGGLFNLRLTFECFVWQVLGPSTSCRQVVRQVQALCRLRNRLRRLCGHPLRYPKAEKLRERLNGPEQRLLLTCFRRPAVPPTNNQAERSLRPVVIMRKVIQGTRSQKGLENHSVLRSLIETAKRQGKQARRFLLDLFTKSTPDAQAALYRNPLMPPNRQPIRRC